MPWQILLLELAWTAGPATFLAAAGGYYLGFGKQLPTQNAVFFIGYTVIFGIIGLVTRVLYRTTSLPRKQRAAQQLSHALDMLPDLFMGVREMRFAGMDPATRRVESVGYLLRRVDLDPQAISLLVEELTGDGHLANLAGKIEMYRRAGLRERMSELVEECRDAAWKATEELSAFAPDTAALLNDRLYGRAPTYKAGLPRPENFIERTLAAIEQDDDNLMTLEDTEQILMLAFELLSGRKMPVLLFHYKGRWETARATDKLIEHWNRYRIAKAVGYSRLRALEELLAHSSETDVTLGAQGQTVETLSSNILEGLRQLNDAAEKLLRLTPDARRVQRNSLEPLCRTLNEALGMHATWRRACSQVGQRHALFLRSLTAWERTVAGRDAQHRTLRPGGRYSGLQLIEREIFLDNEQKLALAETLDGFLRTHRLRTRDDSVVYGTSGRERFLNTGLAKSLAVEVVLRLEALIELSRPEIQRAIYASAAPNFHGLEMSQSAATKAGLGAAATAEVQDDLGLAAERLATVLVTQYQVALTKEMMEFLHRTYGARPERLTMLAGAVKRSERGFASPIHDSPGWQLLADPEWKAELDRARRIVRLAR